MPSLASLSIRGVGTVPPYTPKFPQTTLGFFSWALALGALVAQNSTTTAPNVRLIFLSNLMVCPPVRLFSPKTVRRGRQHRSNAKSPHFEGILHLKTYFASSE